MPPGVSLHAAPNGLKVLILPEGMTSPIDGVMATKLVSLTNL